MSDNVTALKQPEPDNPHKKTEEFDHLFGMSGIGGAIRLTGEHLRSKGNCIWQDAYSRSNSVEPHPCAQ